MECNRDSARRLIRLLVHCCCERRVPVLPCGSWLLRDCLVTLLDVAELCELGCAPDMLAHSLQARHMQRGGELKSGTVLCIHLAR
jgi:hypothetical protein